MATPLTNRNSLRYTALSAIAGVLQDHLGEAERQRRRDPLIGQLDGPGDSELLDELETICRAGETDDPWTVVRFDAWQHQRLAPPWWWLVKALERRIRDDRRPNWRACLGSKRAARESKTTWHGELGRALRYAYSRVRDWSWHGAQLRVELYSLAPYVILGGILWMVAGPKMDAWLGSLTSALAGLTILVAALMKPLRRRLLLSTAQAPTALLRSGDPMADLRRRYAFLLRTVSTRGVLVLVDNLDRCHADYVVELLARGLANAAAPSEVGR